ncbi:choline ABC transporter substrate-binding protein [Burkholderia guangdongensis]|uniref:choline ABC transporter substrate-binding protein n=1 Tax=Burkholderia guangdongensis TaxID=1792500 RepID=UPI0015CA7559|nr:choline ABC transporter substrate-binding protein [Burkholderia guangdongensis]
MKKIGKVMAACLASLLMAGGAHASDGETCRKVTLGDVGWSDIAATTGIATALLEGLGYDASKTIASPPIVLAGLKKAQIDAFLGYWDPSMTPTVKPFVDAHAVDLLPHPNLVGARYTLAVPSFAADAGLKGFADIAKFRDQLDGKIYGIGAGNNGNALVQRMIDKNEFGLGGFKLVESSEAGMLVQVNRAIREHRMVVFLAWEPHPMNLDYKITYLTGGDDVFGPNYGSAKVFTIVAPGYMARCPNVGRLLTNLQFTTDEENRLMVPIMNHADPVAVAKTWLKSNPDVLAKWLDGVTTIDGQDGVKAVQRTIGM